MLKQVRLGYHADRVRVVLDLAGSAVYSVEPQGANLLIVTIREGAVKDRGADTDLYRDEAVKTIKSENPIIGVNQSAVNVSGMLGAAIMPALAVAYGWQAGFVFAAGLAFVVCVVAVAPLPRPAAGRVAGRAAEAPIGRSSEIDQGLPA